MTPQVATSIRIDEDILEGLRGIQERAGIPVSEQMRRALRSWLDAYGIEPSTDVRLTLVERWILANQLHLLERDADKYEAEFYAQKRTAIERGFVFDYDPPASIDKTEVPYRVSLEVCDILDMFRTLQASRQHGKHKTISSDEVAFSGFDGNEEGPHFSYMLYRIVTMKHWDNLKFCSPDRNSHAPMLHRYRAMLGVFKMLTPRPYLSEQEGRRVLDAQEKAVYRR